MEQSAKTIARGCLPLRVSIPVSAAAERFDCVVDPGGDPAFRPWRIRSG